MMSMSLPCLVAESIIAILPHTMEMCLMLPVVAICKLTILIEPRQVETITVLNLGRLQLV